MAGFMNPGLGFASTVGSFIGGAAKQLSANIDAERAQQKQEDVLNQAWAAQFNKGVNEWNKEKAAMDKRAGLFRTLVDQAGGNQRLAEMAMRYYDANPKMDPSQLTGYIATNMGKVPSDGYTSTILQEMQDQAGIRIGQLKQMRDSIQPKNRRFLSNIDEPNFGSPGGLRSQGEGGSPFAQPNPQMGGMPPRPPTMVMGNQGAPQGNPGPQGNAPAPQPGQPQGMSPIPGANQGTPGSDYTGGGGEGPFVPPTGKGVATGPKPPVNPNTNAPDNGNTPFEPESNSPQIPQNLPVGPNGIGSGNPMINEVTNPQLNFEINQGKSTGEIPLDNNGPQGALGPSGPEDFRTPQNAVINQLKFQTNEAGLAAPNLAGGISPFPAKPKSFNEIDQQRINNAERNTDIRDRSTAPSFDVKEGADILKDDVKQYLHNPKDGLQARYRTLTNVIRNDFDLASAQDIIERGFRSDAAQPFLQNMNRFTTAVLGLDLNQVTGSDGKPLTSNVSDINLMKKDVSNAVIDRLTTLHFGRITNYEAQTVRDGFANAGNDPNTNLKIVLIARSIINEARIGTALEYRAVYGDNGYRLPEGLKAQNDAIGRGRAVADRVLQDLEKKGDRPWPVIDGTKYTKQSLQDTLKKMPGQWVEDVSQPGGPMYMWNNGLKKAGDNIHGQ